MSEPKRDPADQPIIQNPGEPPEQFPGIGTDAGSQRSEHDQHVARERRTDQMAGPDGGRWGPTGQSKVGGP